MSLEDLGNIGEFVAAVAVLVSIIYLALQIRANTIVTKAESQRGAAALRMQALTIPASNVDASESFAQGLATPNELSPGPSTPF